MPSQSPDPPNDLVLRQRALARWESEGGKTLPLDSARVESVEQTQIPEMTNAEIVALRVRVIALENVLTSLLASASDHQLTLIREMADYISPRPGFTPIRSRSMRRSIWLISLTARHGFGLTAKVVWPNQQETSQNGRFESP
jgi:hypothetical protein